MRYIQSRQMGLDATNKEAQVYKFVYFDVNSCVDIDLLDHPSVRLASPVRRAFEQKCEDRGFEFYIRLTLYLKWNNFSTTLH